MSELLLQWLQAPDSKRGLRFKQDDGDWSFRSYADLADSVREAAVQLLDAGVTPGSVVCLILPSGLEFGAGFFATLFTGATPCPVAPPLIFRDLDEYIGHAAALLRKASPAVIVSDAMLLPLVSQAAGRAELDRPVLTLSLTGARPRVSRGPAVDLALLQLTSGSTGTPRGVRISTRNLEAHVLALRRWVRWGDDDSVATWLPLYHDMGLIGTLICSVVGGSDVWVMRPDQFIREPADWIECFGRLGATLTGAPTFGYAYAAKRIDPTRLTGMDLSRWRVAVVGAERVDPRALDRFAQLVEPFGFRRQAFLPGYGLAEGTLVLTWNNLGTVPALVQIDWSSLRFGDTVRVLARETLDRLGAGDRSDWLVSNGPPLPGIELAIVGETGAPLGEGRLGEIVARGPWVSDGYHDDPEATSRRFVDGTLHTGDAGFLLDGHLFVLGRMSDSMKVRGRSLYAEDLEAKLSGLPGIQAGRIVVAFGLREGVETAAVVAEAEPGEWADRAARLVRAQAGRGTRVQVVSVPKSAIPRTSSGKPRRSAMWQELLDGKPGAKVLGDTRDE